MLCLRFNGIILHEICVWKFKYHSNIIGSAFAWHDDVSKTKCFWSESLNLSYNFPTQENRHFVHAIGLTLVQTVFPVWKVCYHCVATVFSADTCSVRYSQYVCGHVLRMNANYPYGNRLPFLFFERWRIRSPHVNTSPNKF